MLLRKGVKGWGCIFGGTVFLRLLQKNGGAKKAEAPALDALEELDAHR